MNPGKMRNRIKFYLPTKSSDGFGGFTSSSNSLTNEMWGHAVEKSGEITTKDGKRNYYRQIEVIIRRDSFGTGSAIPKKFSVDGAGYYRLNNYYHILHNDEYTKLIGTLEP